MRVTVVLQQHRNLQQNNKNKLKKNATKYLYNLTGYGTQLKISTSPWSSSMFRAVKFKANLEMQDLNSLNVSSFVELAHLPVDKCAHKCRLSNKLLCQGYQQQFISLLGRIHLWNAM